MEIRFFCNIAIMNDADWFLDDLYILLQFLLTETAIDQGGEAWYFQLLHVNFFHIPANEIAQNCIQWNQQKQRKTSISSFRKYLETQVANVKMDLFSALEISPLHEGIKFIARILVFANENNWEKIHQEIIHLDSIKLPIFQDYLAEYFPKKQEDLPGKVEILAIKRQQIAEGNSNFTFPFSKKSNSATH